MSCYYIYKEKQYKELDDLYPVLLGEMEAQASVVKVENGKETTVKINTELFPDKKDELPLNSTGFTNHSGGAYGGDTFWDLIGREFGVTNHKHYRDAGNTSLSQQLRNTQNIYNKLGNKTVSNNNIIIANKYQKEGVEYAKSIGGIFSLRVDNTNKHFGNPFSPVEKEIAKGLIRAKSTRDAVEKYIDWVINSQDERAIWIREQLDSGELRNKPVVYYKELGEPSHATAL